jgi:hypothetical protein
MGQTEESKTQPQDEEMSMSFREKIEIPTTEVACQNYLRMNLKIRQFSPYICDNLDLDNFGFSNIPKRQLICPMDYTYSHGKMLKIVYNPGKPTVFAPFMNNEFTAEKTLIKVTFSDMLILNEAS